MDIPLDSFSETQETIINTVTKFNSALTILASLYIIYEFFFKLGKKKKRTIHDRLIFACFTFFLLNGIGLFMGSWASNSDKNPNPDVTTSFCKFNGWLIQFSYCYTYFILCIILNILLVLKHRWHTERYEFLFYVCSMFIPVVSSFFLLGFNQYGPAGPWCWIKLDPWYLRYVCLFVPQWIIFVISIVCMIILAIDLYQHSQRLKASHDLSLKPTPKKPIVPSILSSQHDQRPKPKYTRQEQQQPRPQQKEKEKECFDYLQTTSVGVGSSCSRNTTTSSVINNNVDNISKTSDMDNNDCKHKCDTIHGDDDDCNNNNINNNNNNNNKNNNNNNKDDALTLDCPAYHSILTNSNSTGQYDTNSYKYSINECTTTTAFLCDVNSDTSHPTDHSLCPIGNEEEEDGEDDRGGEEGSSSGGGRGEGDISKGNNMTTATNSASFKCKPIKVKKEVASHTYLAVQAILLASSFIVIWVPATYNRIQNSLDPHHERFVLFLLMCLAVPAQGWVTFLILKIPKIDKRRRKRQQNKAKSKPVDSLPIPGENKPQPQRV